MSESQQDQKNKNWEVTLDISSRGLSYTVVERVHGQNAIEAVQRMRDEYGDEIESVDEVYHVA